MAVQKIKVNDVDYIYVDTGSGNLPSPGGIANAVLLDTTGSGNYVWTGPATYAGIIAPFLPPPTDDTSYLFSGTLVPGDIVYGTTVSNTVARAKGTAITFGPAIGYAVTVGAGVCSVRSERQFALAADDTGAPLVPGAQYFLSKLPGKVALPSSPNFPTLPGEVLQKVGIGITAGSILVDCDEDVIVL